MRGRGRMRMNMRRGGTPMMGGRSIQHMNNFNKPRHVLRMPFDAFVSESFYPRVKPQTDDKELTNSLLKRHAELVPTGAEQTSIQSIVLKVQGVLEGLTVAPGSFEACVSYILISVIPNDMVIIEAIFLAIGRSQSRWIIQKGDHGERSQCC